MKNETWRGVQGYEDEGRKERGLEESERGTGTKQKKHNTQRRATGPESRQDSHSPTQRGSTRDSRDDKETGGYREDRENKLQGSQEKGRPSAPQPGPGCNSFNNYFNIGFEYKQ
jgi:hypothetical protein